MGCCPTNANSNTDAQHNQPLLDGVSQTTPNDRDVGDDQKRSTVDAPPSNQTEAMTDSAKQSDTAGDLALTLNDERGDDDAPKQTDATSAVRSSFSSLTLSLYAHSQRHITH